MTLRARVLWAVVGPTVAALAAFSTLVSWRVRADRLADLDAALAANAAALAVTVERDHGVWEVDEPPAGLLASLRGATVEGPSGELVFRHGDPEGHDWRGAFDVPDEPEGGGDDEVSVVVTVWASTDTLDAELRRLQAVMGGVGLLLALGSVGVGWSLSRRIVSAEELRQLQLRFDETARFTADASHELRTPLALIRTEAELALRRERDAATYRQALVGVLAGAQRMQGVVEGLLILARADAGGAPERGEVDLHDVAREVAGAVPVEGGAAPMRGDARLLGILVRNLVENAVRHTPSGKVRVRTEQERGAAVLTVVDEGEGIPADALPHVLERFYRVDDARSRDRGGAGLGLAIVDTVARLHGGRVSLHSELGKGTTVTVRFPSGGLQPSG